MLFQERKKSTSDSNQTQLNTVPHYMSFKIFPLGIQKTECIHFNTRYIFCFVLLFFSLVETLQFICHDIVGVKCLTRHCSALRDTLTRGTT